MATPFDATLKEASLVAESLTWDTSEVVDATDDDIPTIDVGPFFRSGSTSDLQEVASQLLYAITKIGFYQLVGHGISKNVMNQILEETRRFHALPLHDKKMVLMDQHPAKVRGVGYLPLGKRKLPARGCGNPNEAFLIKKDRCIALDDNQWLEESLIPGFRANVLSYAETMESLAKRLLPIYAVALDLHHDYFRPAFTQPFWRLRMTHYPSNPQGDSLGLVGIPPHVDTTFMTLLLPDSPGLVIYSAIWNTWVRVPVVAGAFVVNSGELLRQWSNDRVLSTRHFADNIANKSRYSVPFFFNAASDYPMECLPSCCGPDNPPKYPTISYSQSQGVVQGE